MSEFNPIPQPRRASAPAPIIPQPQPGRSEQASIPILPIVFIKRLSLALRFFLRLKYSWHLAWAKAKR